jgi:hypothetical protein
MFSKSYIICHIVWRRSLTYWLNDQLTSQSTNRPINQQTNQPSYLTIYSLTPQRIILLRSKEFLRWSKCCPPYLKPAGWLLRSQDSATIPYCESGKSVLNLGLICCNTHFNIILSRPKPATQSLYFWFRTNTVYAFLFYPYPPLWFGQRNNVWWGTQVTELPIT